MFAIWSATLLLAAGMAGSGDAIDVVAHPDAAEASVVAALPAPAGVRVRESVPTAQAKGRVEIVVEECAECPPLAPVETATQQVGHRRVVVPAPCASSAPACEGCAEPAKREAAHCASCHPCACASCACCSSCGKRRSCAECVDCAQTKACEPACMRTKKHRGIHFSLKHHCSKPVCASCTPEPCDSCGSCSCSSKPHKRGLLERIHEMFRIKRKRPCATCASCAPCETCVCAPGTCTTCEGGSKGEPPKAAPSPGPAPAPAPSSAPKPAPKPPAKTIHLEVIETAPTVPVTPENDPVDVPKRSSVPGRLRPISHETPTAAVEPERPESAVIVPTSVKAMPDRAENYSWIQGPLQKVHSRGGAWQVRYASHDVSDAYGGSFYLSKDSRLSQFKDGDVVRIWGEVVGSGSSATYQVKRVSLMRRADDPAP